MIPCLSPNGETSLLLDAPPTRLLVGTAAGVVTLGRDPGSSVWREEGVTLAGKHIGALINAPGGRVFAGCHHRGGLFRSDDVGATWVAVGADIAATDIFSLAVVAAGTRTSIFVGVEPVDLYRSDDLGDTWHELPAISFQPGGERWTFPPPPHLPHLKSIALDPSAPDTFFACVEQGALLRTTDGGATWVELDAMWQATDKAYRDAHRLVVAPWDPQLLFFASGIGVYRSRDGGLSWSRCNGVSTRNAYPDVLVASASDRAIFVGGPADVPGDWPAGDPTGTICRSTDEGATWTTLEIGATRGANFEGLTIVDHPGGYTLFAGDTMGRIFASSTAGDDWRLIASTSPVSKGAHVKLANLSVKVPKIVGRAMTLLFSVVTHFTSRRAAARRIADFVRFAGPPQGPI